jgi:hypothetical protein
MVYAFNTHDTSAADDCGKLRRILLKPAKSTVVSIETKNTAMLAIQKILHGEAGGASGIGGSEVIWQFYWYF